MTEETPCDWAYFDDRRMRNLVELYGIDSEPDPLGGVDLSISLTGPRISGKPFLRRAVSSRTALVSKTVSALESANFLDHTRPVNYEDERNRLKPYGQERCSAVKFLIPLKSVENPLLNGFERIGVWISEPTVRPESTPYNTKGPSSGCYLFLVEVPEIVPGVYMGHVSGCSVINILAESVLTKSRIDRLPLRLHPFQLMSRMGAAAVGEREISVLYYKRLVSRDIFHREPDGKDRTYLSMMAYPLAIATHGYAQ